MRRSRLYLWAGLALSIMLFASCGPERESREEQAEGTPQAQRGTEMPPPLTAEQRDYKQQVESRLDQLDKNIQDLKQRVTTGPAKAKPEVLDEFSDLESDVNDVRMRVEKLETEGAEDWADKKQDIEKSMTDLEQKFQDLQAKVGKKPTD